MKNLLAKILGSFSPRPYFLVRHSKVASQAEEQLSKSSIVGFFASYTAPPAYSWDMFVTKALLQICISPLKELFACT